MYIQFNNKLSQEYIAFESAYIVFKSIFKVLYANQWGECKELLLLTMKKYDYIYQILMFLLQNSEYMQKLAEKEKEGCRLEMKSEIELILENQ